MFSNPLTTRFLFVHVYYWQCMKIAHNCLNRDCFCFYSQCFCINLIYLINCCHDLFQRESTLPVIIGKITLTNCILKIIWLHACLLFSSLLVLNAYYWNSTHEWMLCKDKYSCCLLFVILLITTDFSKI